MKHIYTMTILIILSLFVTACGAAPAPSQASANEASSSEIAQSETTAEEVTKAEPIVVGASLPLTGGFSVNGQKHKEGYELCAELLNEAGGLLDRPIELVVSDNRSDTETAISQHERLVNVDQADILFGTFSSKLTFPASTIAEQNRMVYPIPAGSALRIYERGFDRLFMFQPTAGEYVGESPIGVLKSAVGAEDMPKTAAVVRADDFFANAVAAGLLGLEVENPGSGEIIADLAPGSLAEAGIEVLLTETWPEEGFSDWVTLANTIKNSEAELFIALTASAEEAVQLTRALQTVNYQPQVVYLSQGTQSEYLEGVGEAANGVMIQTVWHPDAPWEGVLAGETFSNQDFVKAYEAKHGGVPDEDVAIPFAVCQGMAQAIAEAGTTDNDALHEWLSARTAEAPVKTILGDFHWDERGIPLNKPYLMTQWQDSQLEFVYPLGEFEGIKEFIYPKPEW